MFWRKSRNVGKSNVGSVLILIKRCSSGYFPRCALGICRVRLPTTRKAPIRPSKSRTAPCRCSSLDSTSAPLFVANCPSIPVAASASDRSVASLSHLNVYSWPSDASYHEYLRSSTARTVLPIFPGAALLSAGCRFLRGSQQEQREKCNPKSPKHVPSLSAPRAQERPDNRRHPQSHRSSRNPTVGGQTKAESSLRLLGSRWRNRAP